MTSMMPGPTEQRQPLLSSVQDAGDDAAKALRFRPTIFSAMDPSLTPEQRASALLAVVQQAVRDRETFNRVWAEADGFTYHDQWGTYDAQRRTWAPRGPAPSRRVTRIELNHIQPLCQTVVSLHCAERINWGAAAAPTGECTDVAAAKTGDGLLDFYYRLLDGEQARQEQVEGCFVLGTWFAMPYWDPGAGGQQTEDVMVEPPQWDATLSIMRPGRWTQETKPRGEVKLASFSPHEVLWDPTATTRDPGMWCATQQAVSVAEVLANPAVPEDVKNRLTIETPSANPSLMNVEQRQAMTPRGGAVDGSTEYGAPSPNLASRESMVLYRLFTRSTPQYPRGREYLFAQGLMLWEGDNPKYPRPDEIGEKEPKWPFPIYVFRNYQVGRAFWGQGDVVRIVPAQKALNGGFSKRVMVIKNLAGSVLVKPRGFNFQRTDEPDQVMEVPANLPVGSVYYLQQQQVPPDLLRLEVDCVDRMEYIVGVDKVTVGEMPSANAPAAAGRQLQQRTITKRAPLTNRWNDTWAECYADVLRLVRRHVTTERIVQVVGENRRVSTISFSRSSLTPGLDVVVYQDLLRPRDPGQRMTWGRNLVDMKLVDPSDPKQRAAFLEMMGAGSLARFQTELMADYERARDECLLLYLGEQPPVEFWHDDMADLAVHFAEMNTGTWRAATQPAEGDTPEILQRKQMVRAAFEQHVQRHLFQQSQKLQGIVPGMNAGAPPGAPPGAPAPAGPGAPRAIPGGPAAAPPPGGVAA